jgi:hypothetical protein
VLKRAHRVASVEKQQQDNKEEEEGFLLEHFFRVVVCGVYFLKKQKSVLFLSYIILLTAYCLQYCLLYAVCGGPKIIIHIQYRME